MNCDIIIALVLTKGNPMSNFNAMKHLIDRYKIDADRQTKYAPTNIFRHLRYDAIVGMLHKAMQYRKPKLRPSGVIDVESLAYHQNFAPYDKIHIRQFNVKTEDFKKLLFHARKYYLGLAGCFISFKNNGIRFEDDVLHNSFYIAYLTKKQKQLYYALQKLKFIEPNQIKDDSMGDSICYSLTLIPDLNVTPALFQWNCKRETERHFKRILDDSGYSNIELLLYIISQSFNFPVETKAKTAAALAKRIKKALNEFNTGLIILYAPKTASIELSVQTEIARLLDCNLTVIQESM